MVLVMVVVVAAVATMFQVRDCFTLLTLVYIYILDMAPSQDASGK